MNPGSAPAAVPLVIWHVPRTVQTACDPALARLGLRLGVDLGSDPDPIWSYGHTGVHLYPSALTMAEHLLSEPGRALLLGRRVLELGCGVGVLGPVAALAGAREVILTDFDPVVLDLCAHNQALNRAALAAGAPQSKAEVLVRRLDWRRATSAGTDDSLLLEGIDVVVAADVLYDEGLSDALAEVLAAAAERNPACTILLGVQYREDDPLRERSSTVDKWLSTLVVEQGGPWGDRRSPPRGRSPARSRSPDIYIYIYIYT